jgi:hypothetical protein
MDVFLPLAFLALDLATPHKLAPATQIKNDFSDLKLLHANKIRK